MMLISGSLALAAEIVILEDSFESTVVTNATKIDPVGWDREHDYTTLNDQNTASGGPTTPYGDQFVAIWDQSGIVTTNITDRLQAGVSYTLTFNVGNANAGGDGDPDPGGNHYLAAILAGTNVVASSSGTTDSHDFSIQGVVTVTTDGSNPHLGKVLGIRIAHDGPDWRYKTLIDNVKLVADESDEWKHSLFLGK
jgi:hypothetical protein